MFIVSAGMPKSGSTLFSWYQREIVSIAWPLNGQDNLYDYLSRNIIPGIGHFVENLSEEIIQILAAISELYGPFLVKTHTPLTEVLKTDISKYRIICTFIHRDPRDVILSVIDHGTRQRAGLASGDYFKPFNTVQEAIPFIKGYLHIAEEWIDSGIAEVYKYHDLLMIPSEVLRHFCQSVNVSVDNLTIEKIISKYTSNPQIGTRQFNTGKVSRFREEMNLNDIILCNNELNHEIIKLGYSI